jgi:peroxiredoxin
MKARLAGWLVLAGLLLSGCGAAGAATQAVGAPQAGPAQQAITVSTVDGSQAQIGAGKAAALFFMAAWCGTCLGEADAWRQLVENGQAKDITVLVVDVDPSDTLDGLQRFRASLPSDPLHWVMDRDGQLARRFNVQTLDTTIILDRAGREVYRDLVPSSVPQLQQALSRLRGRQ